MTTEDPPLATALEYAVEQEDPAFRLLRRIVAWTALMYGLAMGGLLMIYVGLRVGVLPNPAQVTFGGTPYDAAVYVLQLVCHLVLVLGGVLLLKGDVPSRSAGIVVIRLAGCGVLVLMLMTRIPQVLSGPLAQYGWPFRLQMVGSALLSGVGEAVLFLLLTLPSLARRMVRA